MMRGCFIGKDNRLVYSGERADKHELEDSCTFYEGLQPKFAENKYDEYFYINGEWVLQVGVNAPTVDQTLDEALPSDDRDPFKKVVFNALYELASAQQASLTKAEYRRHLKRFL